MNEVERKDSSNGESLDGPLKKFLDDEGPGVGEETLRGLEALGGVVLSEDAGPLGLEGVILDGFRVLREVGRGGMGIVYEAEQISLKRRVALKVMRPSASSDRWKRRFQREAQAIAKLKHPGIVPVFASGVSRGFHYFAMEYVEGKSLREMLDSSKRSRGSGEKSGTSLGTPGTPSYFRRCAKIIAEIAEALEAAHRRGVIHRDIKPQNILISNEGRVHLVDFGLARSRDRSDCTGPSERLGTPSYMSPEQVRGENEEIDPRADVYSLGVVLYELLALELPFDGETSEEIYRQIEGGFPRGIRESGASVPEELEAVCHRAMEKSVARRYRTAGAMASELQRLGRRATPFGARDNRGRLVYGIGGGLALAVAVWFVSMFFTSEREPEFGFLFKAIRDGAETLLSEEHEDIVRVGDKLVMDLDLEEELFVYVFNEDREGIARTLFPVHGVGPENPLPPGKHRLPGRKNAWEVTTGGGGLEYFYVIVARRKVDFLDEMQGAVKMVDLDPEVKSGLYRSVGRVTVSDEVSEKNGGVVDRLEPLARGEMTADGFLVRGFSLRNEGH